MDLLASAAPNAAPVVNASVNACMNVGVEAHVRLQIERLRVGDYAGAYSLNSADNQARLGDVATFEGIVKGNASFAALADSANACECLVSEGGGMSERRSVAVRVRSTRGEVLTFEFDVSVSDQGLATNGVRIAC